VLSSYYYFIFLVKATWQWFSMASGSFMVPMAVLVGLDVGTKVSRFLLVSCCYCCRCLVVVDSVVFVCCW